MKSNAMQKPELISEAVPAAEGVTSFQELGLGAGLCRVLAGLGYETPTPIQAKSIPVLLAGRDVIGQAQTGTGKTAAFALPIIERLDFSRNEPQALILAPTRELAIQVAEAFTSYARGHDTFHVIPVYGGQSIGVQLRQLKRNPQVVVGTPGRIMDHLRRGSLSLASIRSLVIDEADEMMSMGFLEDMETIIAQTPAEKQTTLFSATMPKAIRRIVQKYLKEPQEIVVKQAISEVPLITQSCWFVDGVAQKLEALTRILDSSEIDAMLIFVRTKTATVELAERLEARGYSAAALNGDMSQDARERTVERLRKGRLDILIATDVAARGLDVERISHVINFDIPFDSETYTHRIGRTGRAGRSGTAVLFVSSREQGLLRSIERGMGRRLEKFAMPTRDDIKRSKIEKFKAKVVARMEGAGLEPHALEIESIATTTGASHLHIAAALFGLMQEKAPAKKTSADAEVREMSIAPQESRERRPERRERRFSPRSEGDGHRAPRKKSFAKQKPGNWKKKKPKN